DTLRGVRQSAISWTRDGGGFYYSREGGAARAGHALWYHAAGTAQSQDRLVLAVPDEPGTLVRGRASDDGRWLFVTLHRGADVRNRLLVADLVDARRPNVAAVPRALFDSANARHEPLGVVNGMLYLLTDRDAPRRRIVAVPVGVAPATRLTSIVPERAMPIEGAVLLRDRIVLHVLQDVRSRLFVVGLNGRAMGEIALPEGSSVEWMTGRQDGTVLHVAVTSPLQPSTVLRWDGSSVPAALEGARLAFDPLPYETRQHFVVASDGARIPVFVTAPRRVARDSSRHAWLTAYGAFGVTLRPAFANAIPAWLEAGGIWVSAHVRGGGEYGSTWHRAGMREGKRRGIDDFVAVAEWLVAQGYTTRERLAIAGEGHGALLVSAAAQQRPELFGAVLPEGGVGDLLRFHRIGSGA
ncbi:MAG TPA: prolyl oligopeptidase family serine peptidase, partial [Gemmatimonadales bacterium]|nr:prolyl oligopeptidase family serine peptidase [Gemmatimonadales bacterium]